MALGPLPGVVHHPSSEPSTILAPAPQLKRQGAQNHLRGSATDMKSITNPAVAKAFEAYPPNIRRRLLALRELILQTAAATEGVGKLDETLKWGEPAYLTTESGTGSTVRIDWKPSKPNQYAMYFNCQTTLVETFKTLFPREFCYEGNRAIVFQESEPIPKDALAFCVASALTYRRAGKAKRARTS